MSSLTFINAGSVPYPKISAMKGVDEIRVELPLTICTLLVRFRSQMSQITGHFLAVMIELLEGETEWHFGLIQSLFNDFPAS